MNIEEQKNSLLSADEEMEKIKEHLTDEGQARTDSSGTTSIEITDYYARIIKTADKDYLLSDRELYKILCMIKDEFERIRLENILFTRAKELKILTATKQLYKAYSEEYRKANSNYNYAVPEAPLWINAKGNINEDLFCYDFMQKKALKCINKRFYGLDGYISDEEIEHEIYKEISPFLTNKIASKVSDLKNSLKARAFSPPLKPDDKNIHLANGTLNIKDGTFTNEKIFCLNRLNVEWNDDKKLPAYWIGFLMELMNKQDILTLQEYLGYSLIPTNRGQTLLIITGSGGEGKSRIGLILKEIFGKNAVIGKVQDLETNRFAVSALENKLLFIDDDLKTESLKETGTIKSIVTAESQIEVERKQIQRYEADIYARLILFGNSVLSSLYDHTDGFYRRQLIIEVLPKKENRIDDKFLIDKLKVEKNEIFKWCYKGLQRLIKNDFNFTVSERSQQAFESMKHNNFNFLSFLQDENYIKFDKNSSITSTELCTTYSIWCTDNAETRLKDNTILTYLKQNEKKLGIKFDFNLVNEKNRRVRGFKGMKRGIKFYSDNFR